MGEKRIYVIVPETIQIGTPGEEVLINSVYMPPGRLMAQCAHVVSKMRLEESNDGREQEGFYPITTIVLSVRNSKELRKVDRELLADQLSYSSRTAHTYVTYGFRDTNREAYGTDSEQLTAICTTPVDPGSLDHIIGHLELYGG